LALVLGEISFSADSWSEGVGGVEGNVLALSGNHVLDLLHQSHEIGNFHYIKFQFFVEGNVLALSGNHVLDLLHQSHGIGNLSYIKFQFFTAVKIRIVLL
jgi:hypothetical protein